MNSRRSSTAVVKVLLAVFALLVFCLDLPVVGCKARSVADMILQPREIFHEAVQSAIQIQNISETGGIFFGEKEYTLGEIARAQAAAGYFADAIQTAGRIGKYQDQYLADIAFAQARAGDPDAAKETVRQYLPKERWGGALRQVALIQADRGDESGALAVAAQLGPIARDEVLAAIGTRKARAGDLDAASQAAASISSPYSRDEVWYAIVEAQAKSGNLEEARRTSAKIKDKDMSRSIPYVLAKARLEAGDVVGTLRLTKGLAPGTKAGTLLAIAEVQVKTGNHSDAGETLRQATRDALREREAFSKAQELAHIAAVQLRAGLSPDAINALESLPDRKDIRWEWCEIAGAQAEIGKIAAALDSAKKMGDRKACALIAIASRQVDAGDPEGALNTIQLNPNPADISSAKAELASQLAKRGDIDTARRFAEEVLITGAHYEEGYRAPALREIARAQANSGKVTDALVWARGQRSPYSRALALLGVAMSLAERQQKTH